jgi:hypothetical protein
MFSEPDHSKHFAGIYTTAVYIDYAYKFTCLWFFVKFRSFPNFLGEIVEELQIVVDCVCTFGECMTLTPVVISNDQVVLTCHCILSQHYSCMYKADP